MAVPVGSRPGLGIFGDFMYMVKGTEYEVDDADTILQLYAMNMTMGPSA